MKVDDFKVKWKYEKVEITEKKKTDPRTFDTELTTCIIYLGERKDDEKNVATGQALCSVYETFNKDKGRKVSLAKALLSLTPQTSDAKLTAGQRKLRTKFWEAYRTMTPTPRWGKKVKEKVC